LPRAKGVSCESHKRCDIVRLEPGRITPHNAATIKSVFVKPNKDIGKKHVGHFLKAAAALAATLASAPAFSAWEPTKPV
jgi:hypothetical protein